MYEATTECHPRSRFELTRTKEAGTFFPVQLAIQQLLSQQEDDNGLRGSIVMVASRSASGTCPGHLLTAYGGSKGFVKSFCLQVAHEFATLGIRANTISPGYVMQSDNSYIHSFLQNWTLT